MRSAQGLADAERYFSKTDQALGCSASRRVVGAAPRNNLMQNPRYAGIETIERHRMSLAACEFGSPTHVLVNATVFTNNAG